jgi:hypothetical protein
MIELRIHPEASRMTDVELLDLVTSKFGAREFENEMEKTQLLRAFLVNGDREFLTQSLMDLNALEGPKKGIPSTDIGKRNTRDAASLGYVITHELAHVLLGHVTGASTTAYAKEQLLEYHYIFDALETRNSSQFDETQADVFGFSQLMVPAFRERLRRDSSIPYGERDRKFLAIIGQCLEGAIITTLALQLVSSAGGIPTGSSTHPAPAMRTKALCETARALAIVVIRGTSEPDIGPRGPGYFERTKKMSDTFYAIYQLVESIINRCK